jgi:hypothetical protein
VSDWLACFATLTPILPSPIGPARALPCPTYSFICPNISARGLLITLIMEAVSFSETQVNFYWTTWCNIQESPIPFLLYSEFRGFLQFPAQYRQISHDILLPILYLLISYEHLHISLCSLNNVRNNLSISTQMLVP